MSKYELKSYQEDFLEAQEKVGIEVTKGWLAFGQTPAALLKVIYSGPNFDPETKHYAFEGDKLVGFITSSIQSESKDGRKRANLEFPLVLPGHEKASEMLFNKAIDTLKKKGVDVVQTRVGSLWSGTKEKAMKWNYKFARELYVLMEANIKSLTLKSPKNVEILDYDHARDSEQMIKIFVEKFGSDEHRAKANFEQIAQEKETYPIHLIMRENNEIIGRALAYRDQRDRNIINFGTFYYSKVDYLEPLVSESVNRVKKLDQVNKIFLFLTGEALALEKKYLDWGFTKAAKIDYYEKEI